MRAEDLLAERKTEIIRKWFDMVVDTYPADTSRFLKRQKDPFANPVGNTTLESLEAVVGELVKPEMDDTALDAALDPVIRIRAVQTIFHPSQAVGFTYFLKDIIRDMLCKETTDISDLKNLLEFERKIDTLGLRAFNIYMQCREVVLNLRADVEKNRVYRAFSRAGLVRDLSDEGPEPDEK